MKRLILPLVIALLTLPVYGKYKIGVALWPGLTNPDGSGTYLELLKAVYGPDQVEFDFTTYKRMTALFEKANHDLVVGVYKEDVPTAFYSKWHLDIDSPVKAFFLKSHLDINNLADLEGLTLSWIHGYDYHKYIEYDHQPYPINTLKHGFNLLINKRTDALLDYQHNIPKEYKDALGEIEVLPARPIYLAFKNNEGGRRMAETFDNKMLELRKAGKLKTLYQGSYQHTQFASFDHNKPVIVISSNDESLLRLNGFNQVNSLEAKIYQLLLNKLSQYNVQFIKAQFKNNVEIEVSISCFANRIYTKQRAKKYLYSKPFSFYLPPRLYSKSPLPGNNEEAFASIMQSKNIKLGLPIARVLPPNLSQIVTKIPQTKKVEASPHVFSRLKQLALSEEFNATIEYPADISTYWNYISNEGLHSASLLSDDDSPYTLGYLMCKKDNVNQMFIKDFNAELTKLYYRPEFKQILSDYAAGVPKEQLESLINKAFSL